MTKDQIIEKAKELAASKYNQGYDTFVECYDQSDWEAFVEDMTWVEVKDMMATVVDVWNDRRADALNSAF